MVDLHSILANHFSKKKDETQKIKEKRDNGPSYSSIPDVFFDEVLIQIKLSRTEILLMMYLYRVVWCRPNLYKKYGISKILSYSELAKDLNLGLDDLYHALRRLEECKFIETLRPGQYFVRKYFTPELDAKFDQHYNDF